MHKAKYCSTEHRIEANWRKQADKRAVERAKERAARGGKAKPRGRAVAKKKTAKGGRKKAASADAKR